MIVAGNLNFSTVNGDYLGELKGRYQINQGHFLYQVPLKVPLGINGFQPNLSFIFNSIDNSKANLNSILGKSWRLGGVSAISRCFFTTGEGPYSATKGNDDDLCYDGLKMVRVKGSDLSQDSTFKIEGKDDLTIEHLKKYNDGKNELTDVFIVSHKKTGVSSYFINTKIDSHNRNQIRTWLLDYEEDPYGNKINYYYDNSLNISKVSYDNKTIEFIYKTGTDRYRGRWQDLYTYVRYISEVKIKINDSEVSNYIMDTSTTSRSSIYYSNNKRVLNYTYRLDKYSLDSIKQCTPQGDCTEPLRFNYDADKRDVNAFFNIKSIFTNIPRWGSPYQKVKVYNDNGYFLKVEFGSLGDGSNLYKFTNEKYDQLKILDNNKLRTASLFVSSVKEGIDGQYENIKKYRYENWLQDIQKQKLPKLVGFEKIREIEGKLLKTTTYSNIHS